MTKPSLAQLTDDYTAAVIAYRDAGIQLRTMRKTLKTAEKEARRKINKKITRSERISSSFLYGK